MSYCNYCGVELDKTMTSCPLCGLTVVENIPIVIEPNEHNKFYLETKRKKMGHFLELVQEEKKGEKKSS